MTPEENRTERVRVHDKLKEELFKRQNLNSDNFDKSILTYSTAGLGLSLAFLNDFIPITQAAAAWLLYLSWALFVLAVILTMVSFVSSQAGIARQLILNERYYLHNDESVLHERNVPARATEWLNYAGGSSFLVALIATSLFVALNLERAAIVKEKSSAGTPLGAIIPGVQKIEQPDFTRGAVVPGIQAVPAPTPASAAAPASTQAPAPSGEQPLTPASSPAPS